MSGSARESRIRQAPGLPPAPECERQRQERGLVLGRFLIILLHMRMPVTHQAVIVHRLDAGKSQR